MHNRLQQRLVEIGAPEDVRELAAALTEQAVRDPLTGLYNRRFFNETLVRHLETARRYGRDLSLILLDLDHLKAVNDTLGHPAGDETLRDFARLLLKTARKADVVCRIGGDEFAVILPETALPGTRIFLNRLYQRLSPHRRLSAGCGAASLPSDDLYAAADAALLLSKTGKEKSIQAAASDSC